MGLISYAKKELEIAGLFDKDSDYNGLLGHAIMELIEVFSKQDHSGFSASIVIDVFKKLASYKPLQPLTGKDNEWVNGGMLEDNMYQNIRNSAVFKDSKDGKPYFIDAYVKRTPNGHRYSGQLHLKDGRRVGPCYIKDFSNMPTIVIDVLEKEIEKDNWETWVKDESQLEELAKYYDFELNT